jgi:stage III sporulation protein AH
MKANKKKIVILVSLVLLLVATGFLNYFLTVRGNSGAGNSTGGGEISFFSSYRTERELLRAQELLVLEDVIASAAATNDAASLTAAQNKKLSMVDNMEMELIIETLIKAKGFPDCVVTISSANVNVVVKNETELDLAQAAQIFQVITTQTHFTPADIILIPYV